MNTTEPQCTKDSQTRLSDNPLAKEVHSAKDGSVKFFVPDAAPYGASADSTGSEGLTADFAGNIYGAEYTMDVKKYIRK